MVGFFQICVLLGAATLLLQILLSLFGLGVGGLLDIDAVGAGDVDVDVDVDADAGDALNLLSVRALAAGVAVFGVAGLGLGSLLPTWAATPLAAVAGFLAMVGTAWLTGRMLRMQTSGTLRLSGAVGSEATVYLTVPASSMSGGEHGLIQVALQGRTVELRAVTSSTEDLPSGAPVVILSVSTDGETAEVVPVSTFEDMLHEDAR